MRSELVLLREFISTLHLLLLGSPHAFIAQCYFIMQM